MNEMNPTNKRALYRAGAAAALIAAVFFRRNLDAEYAMLREAGLFASGPAAAPVDAAGWFALLHSSPLPGLILLNFFDLVNYLLVGLIFLALAAALRHTSATGAAIAAASAFAAIAIYAASNQSVTILTLSRQYAAAATEAQRALLLDAGQAALAIHRQSGYGGSGLYPSFFLVTAAGMILSALMLRSRAFSRFAAWMGLLANSIGSGYYLCLAFAPGLAFLPLSVSAVFLLAWYVLAGLRLWKLAGSSFLSIDKPQQAIVYSSVK